MTIRAQQRGLTREVDYSKYLEIKGGDVELTWGLGVGDVIESLGLGFVEDALEDVAGVVAVLQTLVDLITEVADYLIVLLDVALVDVTKAFVVVLTEMLNQFINLFTGVSAHFMLHFPNTHKTKRKPSEILYDVGTAYLDNQDDKRPRMVGDVYAVALIALWSLPNIDSLKRAYDQVSSNFRGVGSDFKTLEGIGSRFNGVFSDWQNPLTSEGSSGMAPDFELSGDLTLISPFKTVVDETSRLINILKKTDSYADQIRRVLELTQQRLDEINRIVDEVLSGVASIGALFSFGDANAMLRVEGVGREIDFANAIINAQLDPDYPKSRVIENINNLYTTRGIENPLDRELGDRNLYGGAALIHLQVPNVSEESINALKVLGNAIFKEVKDVATTNERAQAERITAVRERQTKLDRLLT